MRFVLTLLFGIVCLAVGCAIGVWFGPQIKASQPAQEAASLASKVPVLNTIAKPDPDSPYESYEYPTIKWRAKPLNDAPDAIAQLSTTYESGGKDGQGKMKYILTMFKAPQRQNCEVQILDNNRFKLLQFNAADFHAVPGTTDIMEARDSYQCDEETYKKAHDYSLK